MQTYGALAGQVDSTGLGYLNAGFNQAGNVQQAEQTRLNAMLDQLFRENQLQAGLTGGFYQNGGQMSGDASIAGINAGANAAQLTGQGQNAAGNLLVDATKMAVGAKKPFGF
jgi:hypothetical protein